MICKYCRIEMNVDTVEAGLCTRAEEAEADCRQLDENWAAIHEGAMKPIRAAISNDQATVTEIVAWIEKMRVTAAAAKSALPALEYLLARDRNNVQFDPEAYAAISTLARSVRNK
jgi:hypothetical protein